MNEPRPPVGIAVIGQGFMGRAHSYAWARVAQLETSVLTPRLAVLCGRDRNSLETNGRTWGYERVSASWEEVVTSEDVDVVDICTPGASHGEIALRALSEGKHVLCEKPLANSLEEAQRLAQASRVGRDRGVVSMVGFNYRRVPAITQAYQRIRAGELGRIRHVRASYLQDWLTDPEFPLAWRLDADQAGSGALGDLGAHLIDLVRYLTGEEFQEVCGYLDTFIRERPVAVGTRGLAGVAQKGAPRGVVTVDDAFIGLGRLSGGGLVTLEATRLAPGRKNALCLEVNGEAGSLRFDLERLNELEVYRSSATELGFARILVTEPTDPHVGQWWPPGHMLGWEHSFVHECQDLLQAVAGNEPVEPSFVDGCATQAVLEAIAASSRNKKWQAIEIP